MSAAMPDLSSPREYALGIFGATGFTGQRIALYLAQLQDRGEYRQPFLIAGRDEAKLTAVAATIRASVPNCRIDVMSGVNTEDSRSVEALTRRVRIVLTAAGPYRFHGPPVVAACCATLTHYVDVTGEPEYIERMILRHDDEARSRQLSIVHACGFDSVPSELGVLYCMQQFQQRFGQQAAVSHIQAVFTVQAGPYGVVFNAGTWYSLVHGLANTATLFETRRQLKAKYSAEGGDAVQRIGKPAAKRLMYYEPRMQKYCMLFPGGDAAIVRNSQAQLAVRGCKSVLPHFGIAFSVPGPLHLLLFILFGLMLRVLAAFSFSRQLLLRHPRLFSLGFFSEAGPTQLQLDTNTLLMHFFASGYRNARAAAAAASASAATTPAPDAELRAVISMPEAGYVATPIIAVTAALVLLGELDKAAASRSIPSGVLTPAAAFKETDLVERLNKAGVTFSVVE